MAQVPRYTSQATLSNLPSVRVRSFATPESEGAGFGAAIQGVASDALETANAVAVMEAERKVREKRLDLLHNQETGAYNVKGKDALGLANKVTAELVKSIEEVELGLQSPRQKAIFRQRASSIIPETKAELNRYGVQQAQQYESAAIKAYKATVANEAALYYNNPIKIQESVKKVWDANLIEYKDSAPEALDFANKADQSSIYTAAATRLIDDNPLQAQQFYEANRDAFMAEDQQRIERMLEPKVIQYKAMEKADTIMKAAPQSEWRKMAREIPDPTERELVMARFKEEEAIREREQKQLEERARDGAWNYVFEGGSLRTIPAAVLANLDPTDRRQIMAFEQGRAEGKSISTDWSVYEDLHQLPAAELAQTDLSKYYSSLAESERKELIKKKANAVKGTTEIKPELTFEQQFTDTAPGMLFPASAKDEALTRQQKEVLGRVRASAAAELTKQEQAKGGFLPMEERQRIIDQEVMKEWRKSQQVEIDQGAFSIGRPISISEVQPGDWAYIDFDDTDLPPIATIPKPRQDDIRSYGQQIGVTLTDEQVQRIYLLSQVNAPDEVIQAAFKGQ